VGLFAFCGMAWISVFLGRCGMDFFVFLMDGVDVLVFSCFGIDFFVLL